MMKYSFIIPTYNKKKLLRNTLEYLNHQQGYGSIEYEAVVVDDGSTDGTFDYIEGVNKNYKLKYIYLERTEESCRSLARNEGLKNADGKIVVFIDDDILVNSDYLKELERFFEYSENIAVIGTRIELSQNDNVATLNWNEKMKEAYKDTDAKYLEIRYQTFNALSYNASAHRLPWALIFSCNLAVQAEALRKLGGFDEEFKGWGYEDIELGYRLHKANIKIVVNSKLEVMHQGHSKSRMEKNNIELFKKKCLERIDDENLRGGVQVLTRGGVYFNKKFKTVREENLNKEVIDFRNKNELSEVKRKVLQLLEQDGLEIVINDYVEDTDLDIWVQLLELKGSLLLYYPKSKPTKLRRLSFIDDIMMSGYSQRKSSDISS